MKNILILLTSLTLLTACQTTRGTLPKDDWRNTRPQAEASKALKLPKFQQAKLPNGLTVYVVEDHSLPIVQVKLSHKAGSALDPEDKAGTAELTYKLMLQGSGQYDALQFVGAAAKLGTEVSFGVTQDSGGVSMPVTRKNLEKALEILATLQNAHLHAKDFKRVKKQKLDNLKAAQSQPQFLANQAFYESAYGKNNPYGHLASGSYDSVEKIKLKDLKTYFKNHIRLDNSALILTGDVSLHQATKLAQKYFGKRLYSGQKNQTQPRFSLKKRTKTQVKLIGRKSSPQSFIIVGRPLLNTKDKDQYAYLILNEILGGVFSSRLNMNLREDKGWTYGARSSVTPLKNKGPFLVYSSIQVPYGADALAEIFKEFKNMRTKEVTAEELNSAITGIERSFGGQFSSVGSLAEHANELFVYNLPNNYFETYVSNIKKVTAQECLKVAQKMLDPSSQTVVAVGDLSALEKPVKALKLGKATVAK